MSTTTNLGGHLVFFLFLLIPGYVSLRAYLWANIALDDIGRLDKLVDMAVGGFMTIVLVEVIREVGISKWLWEEIFSSFLPSWLAFSAPALSIQTVSTLTILESFTLISSQIFIGSVLGFLYGASKYVFADGQRQKRRDLKQPWDMVAHKTSVGDEITVVTAQDREIRGIVEQIGSPSKDYDLLISDPVEVIRGDQGQERSTRNLGKASYHHYQDISRIEFEKDLIPEQKSQRYTLFLQKIVEKRLECYQKYVAVRGALKEQKETLPVHYLNIRSHLRGGESTDDDEDETTLELENADSE